MQILIIILFWFIYLTVVYGCWWVLEKHYPKPFSCFDFKPFKCRKCLTTWALIGIYISVGVLLNNYVFMTAGIILSILTGVALYVDENERFKI